MKAPLLIGTLKKSELSNTEMLCEFLSRRMERDGVQAEIIPSRVIIDAFILDVSANLAEIFRRHYTAGVGRPDFFPCGHFVSEEQLEERWCNYRRGYSHEQDHTVKFRSNHCEAQTDLGDDYSDLASRHHSHAHLRRPSFAQVQRSCAAT